MSHGEPRPRLYSNSFKLLPSNQNLQSLLTEIDICTCPGWYRRPSRQGPPSAIPCCVGKATGYGYEMHIVVDMQLDHYVGCQTQLRVYPKEVG